MKHDYSPPLNISLSVPSNLSAELRTMALLEAAMDSQTRHDHLDGYAIARIARWFAERYQRPPA